MDLLLTLVLPVMVAAGASLITYSIMQARAEALCGRYAGVITGLRATVAAQEKLAEERAKAAAEAARRRAYDEFLADLRVEDRRVTRGRATVCQERVSFRTIPLTAWADREADIPQAESQTRLRMLTCP